ncbi:hypothetical protein ATB54_06585 [Xanthomonas translucens]|nr:hypothetical protein ATB54_06585 [Xanthomonas translucens]
MTSVRVPLAFICWNARCANATNAAGSGQEKVRMVMTVAAPGLCDLLSHPRDPSRDRPMSLAFVLAPAAVRGRRRAPGAGRPSAERAGRRLVPGV